MAFRLFADEIRIPKLFIVTAFTYYVLMELPASIQSTLQPSIAPFIFFFIPQCLKLRLVIHAVHITLRGREFDLIESRLQLQTPVALTFAAVVTTVIMIEVGFDNDVPELVGSGGQEFCSCLYLWLPS